MSESRRKTRHELRTPLNQIIGYSEMLKEEAEAQGHAAYVSDLEKIGTAGRRLLALIDEAFPSGESAAPAPAPSAPPSEAFASVEPAPEAASRSGSLDLDLEPPELEGGTPAAPVRKKPTSAGGQAGQGNLLVVDDNEMNRDMLARRLERKGYDVDMAEDGHRALEMVAAGSYDLILLDVMMPGINGIEVLKTLRRKHSVADLPVIMATAKDSSEDVVEALQSGANDYVTKPLDFPVVQARVETQLSLKRLSALKDEFLRIASHDLKNPITVILGMCKLIQVKCGPGSAMTEDSFQLFTRIRKRTQEMQRIIEDFLDFQALDEGNISLKKESTDLNEIAREVAENNSDYAREKEVEVVLELDSDLPVVEADPARIAQVVQNFVGNAVKFGPPGSKAVVRTRVEAGGTVLEVSDTGPGLTDDDLKKMFRKYARLSNKPTGGEKSSGLGLAICKQFVELHGGEIGVHNNPDRGATFWFRLG